MEEPIVDGAPSKMAGSPRPYGTRKATEDATIWGIRKEKKHVMGPKRGGVMESNLIYSLQELEMDGIVSHRIDLCGVSSAMHEGIKSQRKKTNDCAANRGIDRSSDHHCPCGRSFRIKGDLTRHSRFCNSTNQRT